jgi:hypothetical protein
VPDLETPAAVQWFIHAGWRLRAGVLRREESWVLERQRDFGKEAKAMSEQRWAFWRAPFEVLRQQAEVTQVAAAKAVAYAQALGCIFPLK